jgi:hypothetical protein
MHSREEIFGHGFRFAKHADFTDTSPFYRDLRGVRGANMKELLEILSKEFFRVFVINNLFLGVSG